MSVVVNPYNFLRWNDLGNGPADPTSGIATGYMRNSSRCPYMPIMKHTEAMRFFINTENGLAFVVDTNIKLQLVNASTGAIQDADVAVLQVCNFTNPASVATFTYYAEVTLTNTVPEGQYYFVIKGDTRAWLQSNNVYVVSVANAILTGTSLAEFRHNTWYYGTRYNDLSTFTHQYRLHINLLEDQEESSVDVFTEVTTGKKRTYKTVLDLIKTVETYFFDAEAHKAAIIMFKHDEFYLNGRQYAAKDAYKEQPDATTKLTKGTITLYDQEFASVNSCS